MLLITIERWSDIQDVREKLIRNYDKHLTPNLANKTDVSLLMTLRSAYIDDDTQTLILHGWWKMVNTVYFLYLKD